MERRYDVYIGGKPLRFGPPGDIGRFATIPEREVRDHGSLREAIQWLGEEGGERGLQLVAKGDFDPWDAFRADHKFVLAAGGVVVDENGRLLAIRRLGKWDLPKGKVEKDEDVEAAAVREVQEECGLIKISMERPITSTWHTYERKGKQHLKRTDWFLMRATSDQELTAQAEEDIEEVCWLDAAGVRRMEGDTYPSLLPVIQEWKALGDAGITRPTP